MDLLSGGDGKTIFSRGLILFLCLILPSERGFYRYYENLSPEKAQSDPSRLSLLANQLWVQIERRKIEKAQQQRLTLRKALLGVKKKLSYAGYFPEPGEAETQITSTYDRLPAVYVDQDFGAVFPRPISKPSRFSWYQNIVLANEILKQIDRLHAQIEQVSDPKLSIKQFEIWLSEWNKINTQWVQLTQQVRYLEAWMPQLENQWQQQKAQSRKPASYVLIHSLFFGDERLFNVLREILRPHRIMMREFLPDVLDEAAGGVVILPIATDISDSKFLSEIEGALATHWNQSSWARVNEISFHILWNKVPKNIRFKTGKETLAQHIQHFPEGHAVITTGGLTTSVRGRALILGPGRIQPRTLAHELGHLIGFDDCYLRTLSGQGLYGLAVLEWDNPLYPDDLMCDNYFGEPRAEVW